MARAVRQRAQQSLYADEDSEPDENTEGETTPKAKRTAKAGKLKKRVSDIYQPDGGSSPHQRVPFQAVNMNDDEAEKRKRRRSAKHAAAMALVDTIDANGNALPGPSSQDGETPRASRHLKQKQQLLAVADAPVINVPRDVMSSNFEEWMKMATDNKINATNSWNFALIDYFHDMSLLRNIGDNSINFQKASCTLDGCVKIWTSRVDSVGTETGKLLSNLATEGKENEDAENSDNPDANEQTQRKRDNKARRSESTLAKKPEQLRSKKLDLEFSVDPLFKKTCADFDEGGAHGLLLNHLSLGTGSEGSMRVIFDASDSMGQGKKDEDEPDEVEPVDLIDFSHIRSEFVSDLSVLEGKAIASSLQGFAFAQDALSFDASNFLETIHDDGDDDDFGADFGNGGVSAAMDVDGTDFGGNVGPVDTQDFFSGDQDVGADYGSGDYNGGGGDFSPIGDDAEEVDENGVPIQPARTGGFEPFDPRRAPNERDLLLAMTEPGANGSSFDYFDQTFLKNWAGPEHWKLRKVIRRPEANADGGATKPKPREKKEPFKIDFLTPSTKTLKEASKDLFAPVGRGGSITLPQFKKKGRKGKSKGKRNEQTLPDDMHFSSRQLITLFLKPKFALKMRGSRARLNADDGEIDTNFWAQAAADQAAGRVGEDGEEITEGAIPFNTQFFHDDYDDGPGFDDIYDGDADGPTSANPMRDDVDSGERDLLAETQNASRRVRPEMVNFAKRAKRVDVRKLKENIWKGLDIVIPAKQDGEDGEDTQMRDVQEEDVREPTHPEDARVFTNVITGLQSSYPKDKMADISTSFCFICLLHLANERGLKLEVGQEEDEALNLEDIPEEARVGDLWGLKVFRDPNAVPGA